MGPNACMRLEANRSAPYLPLEGDQAVKGYGVLLDGDLWGLLQSPNCKKRVTKSHPHVAVDY
jgi:hypothetical protein